MNDDEVARAIDQLHANLAMLADGDRTQMFALLMGLVAYFANGSASELNCAKQAIESRLAKARRP